VADLKKAIGKLLMVGIPGESASQAFLEEIQEWSVGGVIFFARHLKSLETVKSDMKKIIEACGYEPLFAVDHEGGPVLRFNDTVSELPAPMALVSAGGGDLIRRASCFAAIELAELGFNTNLAPVCDINEINNPGIGIRSFGENPQDVSKCVYLAATGFHEGGVLTSAKHFPGKGAALVDAHVAMPVVEVTRQRLVERELLPFKAALKAGTKIIMSSHMLFPNLDKDNPVTFSRKIVDDLIRGELDFDGIVISDDLEMGGSRELAEPSDAALMCLKGGHDMAMICHTFEAQCHARRKIFEAVENGTLPQALVEEKVERIDRVLEDIEMVRKNSSSRDTCNFDEEEMNNFAARGIICTSENLSVLPFIQDEFSQINLYVPDLSLSTPSADDRSGVLSFIEDLLDLKYSNLNVLRFALDGTKQNDWESRLSLSGSEKDRNSIASIIFTNNAHLHEGQISLLSSVYENSKITLHVALRNPYDLDLLQADGNKLVSVATYGFRQNTLKALVDVLHF